jgi:hypothetical protein
MTGKCSQHFFLPFASNAFFENSSIQVAFWSIAQSKINVDHQLNLLTYAATLLCSDTLCFFGDTVFQSEQKGHSGEYRC